MERQILQWSNTRIMEVGRTYDAGFPVLQLLGVTVAFQTSDFYFIDSEQQLPKRTFSHELQPVVHANPEDMDPQQGVQ